jgi:5-amino-6-(5-phosphoribosylamino)uracil reductase
MADRPYTVLSCGISLDGYLDNADRRRLILSNDADLDRVDAVRASCDAIMVGAATVRNDNPRLLVKSPQRRAERVATGRPSSPMKVTVTRSGRLDPQSAFFGMGSCEKLVYCPVDMVTALIDRLGSQASVVGLDSGTGLREISEDLSARGVNRLMVEGGGTLHTQFLTAELADELQLVIAPLFVGDSRARRFVESGRFPWQGERRAELAEARPIGDVVLLRYALSTRFCAESTVQ